MLEKGHSAVEATVFLIPDPDLATQRDAPSVSFVED